jgi:hypothetical protein
VFSIWRRRRCWRPIAIIEHGGRDKGDREPERIPDDLVVGELLA